MRRVPIIRTIRADQADRLLDGVRSAGVGVILLDLTRTKYPSPYVCSLGRSKAYLWILPCDHPPQDIFVELSRPPYQLAFWRWREDYRLYNCLVNVIQSFDDTQSQSARELDR